MDKLHFYQRLMRWQHLRFDDVVLRERPDTPAWSKKYEIYIQDKSKLSAQLYIRTTQPGEEITLVMAEYLRWLEEYNDDENGVNRAQESVSAALNKLKESCRPHSGNHQPRIHTPNPGAGYTRSLS